MKNIFLLNTDEESNLFEFGGELVFEENYKENFRSKFIYITSDELPKLDEWGINLLNNIIFKDKGFTSNRYSKSNFRKIVLTNDTTLINDGVQEVSSVFLSFFAENPIDYVEVKKGFADGTDYGYNFLGYSLVFPQKELKEIKNEGVWVSEISSGYAGYRNTETFEWIYEEEYSRRFKNEGNEEWLSPMQKFRKKEIKTEEKLFTKEDLFEVYKQANTIFNDKIALREEFEEWFNNYENKKRF